MAKKSLDKSPTGPQLDILTAQHVFGWKNVHTHEGELVGKKPDKLGRLRPEKVPSYSTDPHHAYLLNERMKQLGRSEQYLKELAKLTRSKKLPAEWATPDQRCQAALRAVRSS